MKCYREAQLVRFLRAVDSHLSSPFELIIIGGAAVLLGYGIDRVTTDIDTLDSRFMEITEALDAARKETGVHVPVGHPGVEDYPHDMEERLQEAPVRNLKYLVVRVPEKHDLVLMKTVRGEETDYQAAVAIHSAHSLDIAILVERFTIEMRHVIGPDGRMRLNFLELIDRLFGEEEARRLEAELLPPGEP